VPGLDSARPLPGAALDNNGNTRLHILILTDRDWTHPQAGGTGTNLFGHVSRWIAWGHRVSLIACGYPGGAPLERIGALTIHRVGGRSTVFPQAILRQWRGLVPDADVALEVVNGITFLTPLWLRTPHVTLIHHIHRHHYVREMGLAGRVAGLLLETLPLRLLYRRSRFMTISRASAADIAAHGIPPERIAVNYIGVELGAFGPDASRRAPGGGRRRRPGRARRQGCARGHRAPSRCACSASADRDEAALAAALEDEVARRGLRERVRFHGHVSEERKRELYQQAWVNVVASSAEGWCLSVMEAAACGTPSAALAIGGLPESIDDERTGVLARDTDELAAKVGQLLHDPDRREHLGRAARERTAEFAWDATARRTLSLLEGQRLAATAPGGVTAASDLLSPEPGTGAPVSRV